MTNYLPAAVAPRKRCFLSIGVDFILLADEETFPCMFTRVHAALRQPSSPTRALIDCGSVFSCCRRPPVPSVIHEPSAWASAVSDVCQTGPHLSPCTSSNCILVCMPRPPPMPPQQSTVSRGTSARLSIKS